MNLRIPAGATVAIVGHTGSGKSTLAHLVPRLIDPSAGTVTLDGIDLREFSPEDLRRAIGYVPQETFLFSATLGENIAFGVKDATEERSGAPRRSPAWRPTSRDFPKVTRPLSVMVRRPFAWPKQCMRHCVVVWPFFSILISDDALANVMVTEEGHSVWFGGGDVWVMMI